jgi:hypothetical protein
MFAYPTTFIAFHHGACGKTGSSTQLQRRQFHAHFPPQGVAIADVPAITRAAISVITAAQLGDESASSITQSSIKTRNLAGMTCRPFRLHQYQKRITIAVYPNLSYLLCVPGDRAFMPQFSSASTPEHRLATLKRLPQRLRVHIRHHQHLSSIHILYHRRN